MGAWVLDWVFQFLFLLRRVLQLHAYLNTSICFQLVVCRHVVLFYLCIVIQDSAITPAHLLKLLKTIMRLRVAAQIRYVATDRFLSVELYIVFHLCERTDISCRIILHIAHRHRMYGSLMH